MFQQVYVQDNKI